MRLATSPNALRLSQVSPSVIAVVGFISFNTTTNYIDTLVKKLANRINDIKNFELASPQSYS
jgi:uncharacterized protein (UPF0305 family)